VRIFVEAYTLISNRFSNGRKARRQRQEGNEARKSSVSVEREKP
jgi:hypothetical protein